MDSIFGDLLAQYQAQIKLGTQMCLLFSVVLQIALVFWIWRDANRRGAMGWLWGIAAILFFPLFPWPAWIVYLIVRPPETLEEVHERALDVAVLQRENEVCPACYKPIDKDYLICPYCMKKLNKPCVECGKALKLNWGVCPYCRTKQ